MIGFERNDVTNIGLYVQYCYSVKSKVSLNEKVPFSTDVHCFLWSTNQSGKCPKIAFFQILIMPPTLKKLEGHIAFCLCVCVCVCPLT